MKLDFGNDVPLGANPKLYLHIKNKSAIATVFSVNAEHFFSKPPTPPEAKNRPQLSRYLSWIYRQIVSFVSSHMRLYILVAFYQNKGDNPFIKLQFS